MKKCNNCGTEFEGDVCPNCQETNVGEPAVSETVAYAESPAHESAEKGRKRERTQEITEKICLSRKIVLMLSPVLFVLFSVFLWLFYTMPVAVIRGTSLGNIFSMQAVYEAEFSNMKYIMLGLAGVCSLYAAVSLAVSFMFIKKGRVSSVKHLSSVNYIGYVCVFICACVTAAKVNAVYAVNGACLNLCLAFSVSFAILSVACGVCDEFIWNKNGVESSEKSKKGRNAPFIAAIAVVLVAAISLSIALPVASYNFFASKVSAIDYGDDQKKVRSLLGDPDFSSYVPSSVSSSNPMWMYVNPEARRLVKDAQWLELYNKYLPSDEKIDDVITAGSELLTEKISAKLNKAIIIMFDTQKNVAGVVLYNDLDVSDLNSLNFNFDKRITRTTVAPVFSDIDWKDYSFEIKVFYEDGSYVCRKQEAYNCVEQQGRLKLTFLDEVSGEYFVGYANKLDVEKSGQAKSNSKFQYKVLGNMAVITKYIGNAENVTVPARLDGNEVVAIGASAFAGNKDVKNVTINGAKTIKANAFNGCTNLESVELNQTLHSIEENAFANCSSLESVSIPSSVEKIGDGAFLKCTSLANVTGNSSGSLKTIGSMAFAYCESLTSITVPTYVERIGANALSNSGVTRVIFSNTIGWKAKKGNTEIEISASDLSYYYDSKAAVYLTITYVDYEWINSNPAVAE